MRQWGVVWGALFIAGIGTAMAQNQVPISVTNWLSHPDSKKIRLVYREVNELLKGGGLRREIRRFEYCGHNEGNLRERYTHQRVGAQIRGGRRKHLVVKINLLLS